MDSSQARSRLLSNRRRKLTPQEKVNCQKIVKEAKNFKKTSIGLSSNKLNSLLSDTRNFIGIYPQDEVDKISVSSFPVFFIVNLDSKELPGSHWLAIGLFVNKLEIFDSLGFKLFDWPRVPCSLLNFLQKFSQGRKVSVSNQMQSLDSNNCAFYCLYYVIFRNIASFNQLKSLFTSNYRRNDNTIKNIFG